MKIYKVVPYKFLSTVNKGVGECNFCRYVLYCNITCLHFQKRLKSGLINLFFLQK